MPRLTLLWSAALAALLSAEAKDGQRAGGAALTNRRRSAGAASASAPAPAEDGRETMAVGGGVEETNKKDRGLLDLMTGATPVQTYFVPLPEPDLFQSFKIISVTDLNSQKKVMSLISITVSVTDIVLWYDHWEDGYEEDVTNPTKLSTMIWGDGDPLNGCIEMARNKDHVCQAGDNDKIYAGEAFVLENWVSLPRDEAYIKYDGRDVIKASFPIAITRAAYPKTTGSLLAGAVEVLESKTYGTQYISPVGTNTPSTDQAFSLTELYVIANEDNTVVTYDGNDRTPVLNIGESMVIKDVRVGKILETNNPVMVDLLTGMKNSNYQMRWYSLIPKVAFYHDYYTPIHDTGNDATVVYLFNPSNDNSIQVKHHTKTGIVKTYNVDPKKAISTNHLPAGTGSRFKTDSPGMKLFAITVTDISIGHGDMGGQVHDWGHPLIPANKLTSQALIGLGYGCTDNDCDDGNWNKEDKARSVVWVTPAEDCDLFVDYNGDGNAQKFANVPELDARTFSDQSDYDMTGATIYATEPGNMQKSVKIAVAWGQDPKVAEYVGGTEEKLNMDMGTVVPPLPEIAATKSVSLFSDNDGDGRVSPGDVLQYTIRITNTGKIDVPAGSFHVVDDAQPLFEQTDYEQGTTDYMWTGGARLLDDDDDGSFPLDGSGVLNSNDLLVATAHHIRFRVKIKSRDELTWHIIENTGRVMHNEDGEIDSFYLRTPIHMDGPLMTTQRSYTDVKCLNFDATVPEDTTLGHFAFVAEHTDCVFATVYVSGTPLTSTERSTGNLGGHWKIFCDGAVRGKGDNQHTYIPPAVCFPHNMYAGVPQYFYISMETTDGFHCINDDESASWYELVGSVEDLEGCD